MLAPLSFEHSFYGQLAMEELGTNIGVMTDSYRPSPEEIAAMERTPGIQRALKFYQLGLRYEGALEWRWTTRGLGDKELIAAAEVARVHGWYERSIDTADRTQTLHDFALRFPTPYREVVSGYSQQLDSGRSLGVRAGAPGEPVFRGRALERRRRGPHAVDAGRQRVRSPSASGSPA